MSTTKKDRLITRTGKLEQPSPLEELQWIYVSDSNQGQYSNGVCKISTEILSNGGKLVDYSQAYLSVPYVVVLTKEDDANPPVVVDLAVLHDYKVALKTLPVNSLRVDMNNSTLVESTNYTSMYMSALHYLGANEEDEAYETELFMKKDSPDSWMFSPTVGANGLGLCNNINKYAHVSGTGSSAATPQTNEGMLSKQVTMSNQFVQGTRRVTDMFNAASISTTEVCKIVKGANRIEFHLLVKIPLFKLCPFFGELHLNRGSFFKLELGHRIVSDSSKCIPHYAFFICR